MVVSTDRKCDGILVRGTEPGCYSTNYTNVGMDVRSSLPPTVILVRALFRRGSIAVKYEEGGFVNGDRRLRCAGFLLSIAKG